MDFTSASEWEVFTSRIEETLLSWQLSIKDREEVITSTDINGDWKFVSEDISFAGDIRFIAFPNYVYVHNIPTCIYFRPPFYDNPPLGWGS